MKYLALLAALGIGSAALVTGDALAHSRDGARLERLKAADNNADGLLSREEAQALPRLAERFDAIDSNRDGQIAFEELRAARKAQGGQRFVRALDADGDGRVSKTEALTAAEARFQRADANGDGFLTAEEIPSKRHHKHARQVRQNLK